MTLLDVVRSYYRRQRAIARRTQDAARQVWRSVDPADLNGSWRAQADRMLVTVAAGQLLSAQGADLYLDEVLSEQGFDVTGAARTKPTALAGVASDGRSLDTLLNEPGVRAQAALGGRRYGADPNGPIVSVTPLEPAQAMATGEAALLTIVGTQVQDAGRVATGVGITARPEVTTWVRLLSPPSCGRCAILAGRRYRYSDGFQRHPNCDCLMVPASEDVAGDLRTDPRAYFASLTRADQERYFGVNNTRAILDGADMNQVVNAGRSTDTAGGRKFTRDGATRIGAARGRGAFRPTPEQIYAEATDRDDAIRLLRRFGFIF